MKVVSCMEDLMVQGTSGQGDRPADKCPIQFRTTISDRGNEVVEILPPQKVDLYCLQETRWRGESANLVKGKDSICKSLE